MSPPFLVATKLEAFTGRGREDYLGSRDFADVVSLIDGREELVDEVRSSPAGLREYLAAELERNRASSTASTADCCVAMRARQERS